MLESVLGLSTVTLVTSTRRMAGRMRETVSAMLSIMTWAVLEKGRKSGTTMA